MAEEINISVTGNGGVGKSTIVEIIRRALEDHEFASVTVSDTESDPSDLDKRIETLNKAGVTKINIGTHQTIRHIHKD